MRRFKKAMALFCALTLLVTCTIAGLALPVSAEGDTFKLMYDELFLAPTDSGSYLVYAGVPALTMDGKKYTEIGKLVPGKLGNVGYRAEALTVPVKKTDARYVKLVLTVKFWYMCIDEIAVQGQWK
jgi:hypothetical protein